MARRERAELKNTGQTNQKRLERRCWREKTLRRLPLANGSRGRTRTASPPSRAVDPRKNPRLRTTPPGRRTSAARAVPQAGLRRRRAAKSSHRVLPSPRDVTVKTTIPREGGFSDVIKTQLPLPFPGNPVTSSSRTSRKSYDVINNG